MPPPMSMGSRPWASLPLILDRQGLNPSGPYQVRLCCPQLLVDLKPGGLFFFQRSLAC